MNKNSFISSMFSNNTFTENGMPAHTGSMSALVDMLFKMGAIRTGKVNDKIKQDMITLFAQAFREDEEKAVKLLFYGRDIESGMGEREFFRVNSLWLIRNGYFDMVQHNLLSVDGIKNNIIRTDDIIYIANELVILNKRFANKRYDEFIFKSMEFLFKLLEDSEISSIVAKWMPRKNGKYKELVAYMRKNGLISTFSNYRKFIVSKTNVVEQLMSAKNWKNIDLSKVPSLAMKKYRKAFRTHGILQPFIEKVVAGEAKLHAKRLFPHEIILDLMNAVNWRPGQNRIDPTIRSLFDEQWKALKNIDELNIDFRALPIIDVSGSMLSYERVPISIALGIGFFLAERNPNSAFRDYFITFSSSPAFQKIIGHDIASKIENALKADWAMSTNLEETMRLILKKAISSKVPADEMPTHLIIISDMQFDRAVYQSDSNATQMIRTLYAAAGYEMPNVIFWNAGPYDNVPAQINDNGVFLISGKSQNNVNFILKKSYENMLSLVDEITNSSRYDFIRL